MSLPTLPVEYPAGHPLYRPAPGVDGESAQQAERRPSRPPTAEELAQAAILARCAIPLSVPNSPAEQARRMSVGPASRRNSILSIPPPVDNTPKPLDHTPMPGHDEEVDQKELDKELEEIDTIG